MEKRAGEKRGGFGGCALKITAAEGFKNQRKNKNGEKKKEGLSQTARTAFVAVIAGSMNMKEGKKKCGKKQK